MSQCTAQPVLHVLNNTIVHWHDNPSAGMTVIGYVVLPVAVANCVGFLTQLAHVIATGQNSRIRS
jgi:hypothetical protein